MREVVMELVNKFFKNCEKLEPAFYITYKGDKNFLIREAIGKTISYKGSTYHIKLEQFNLNDIKIIEILTGKPHVTVKAQLDGTFNEYLGLYSEVYNSVVDRAIVNPLTYKIDGFESFIIGFNQAFEYGNSKLNLCYNTDTLLIGNKSSIEGLFNPTKNFRDKIKFNRIGIPVGNPYGFDKALLSGEIPERAGNTAISILLNNCGEEAVITEESLKDFIGIPSVLSKTVKNSVAVLSTKQTEILQKDAEPLSAVEEFINSKGTELRNSEYILQVTEYKYIIRADVFVWNKEVNDIEIKELRLLIDNERMKLITLEEGNKLIKKEIGGV